MSKRRKKKKGRKKFLLIVFEILLLAILLACLWIYNNTFKQIDYEDKLNSTEAGVNQDIDESTVVQQEGYTNIALFGLDNRSSNSYAKGNSDTIMIASIDNVSKEVRLVSIYRDTFLNIGNDTYRKANAAYANGGAIQALQMLNTNFDLTITEYVCVDWAALVKVIDALGGIDLEITEGERSQINKYMKDVDQVTGYTTSYVSQTGLVHLDGTQATTYARIRKLAGDDYKRASRQRIVLQAILEKAKKANIATLTQICTSVFGDISTNLEQADILVLLKDITAYDIVATTGFPFELTTVDLQKTGSTVIPIGLTSNVEKLHKFLYNGENYMPSNTVQNISSSIESLTGVTASTAPIDVSEYNDTVGKNGTEASAVTTDATTAQ